MKTFATQRLNRLLVRLGLLIVQVPPSTKTLRAQAGRVEVHRHGKSENYADWAGGANWIRQVAAACDEARFHRRSALIKDWRCRCGKKLSEPGGGCEWHVNNRAQALTGEANEEQCR